MKPSEARAIIAGTTTLPDGMSMDDVAAILVRAEMPSPCICRGCQTYLPRDHRPESDGRHVCADCAKFSDMARVHGR